MGGYFPQDTLSELVDEIYSWADDIEKVLIPDLYETQELDYHSCLVSFALTKVSEKITLYKKMIEDMEDAKCKNYREYIESQSPTG